MARTGRKLLLAGHLTVSVGWIGAALAYLALAVAIPTTDDTVIARSAWVGMELVGWFALAPLAVLTLITGIALAAATPWGIFRHYWVVVSFVSTTVLAVILLIHLRDVSRLADRARAATNADLASLGSDIPHAAIGVLLLTCLLVLNVLKPPGLTRRGWRERQRREV